MVLADAEAHGRLELELEGVVDAATQQAAVRAHRHAVVPHIVVIVEPQVELVVLHTGDFQELGIVGQHPAQAHAVLDVLPAGAQEVITDAHILLETALLGGIVGPEADFRVHVVEVVLDAVAVGLVIVLIGIPVELRAHPVGRVTVEVGELVVVVHGGIERVVFEDAVEEEVHARVARGGVRVLLLLLADRARPRREVVEVQAVGVFRTLAVVHRQFSQRRDRVAEAELDVVAVIALLDFGVELAHLHVARRELHLRLRGSHHIVELHLLAHHRVPQHCLLVDFVGIGQLRHVLDQQLRRIDYLRIQANATNQHKNQ